MKIPEMIKVESSQIETIGYDAETSTLHVHFKRGGKYSYSEVPADVRAAFMAAESKGKFLGAEIKGKFTFTKYEA